MWLIAAMYGCGPEDGPAVDTSATDSECPASALFVAGPTVRGSDPLFPMSRAVTVTVAEPATLQVTATDANGGAVAWVSPSATVHDLPLVGLHAGGTWTLAVSAVTEDGCTAAGEVVSFATDSLPTPFPTIDVLTSLPEEMEPGLTIVPIYTKDIAYIALVNAAGQVVWLYGPTPEKFTEIRPLASGNLLALNDFDIVELDWMGILRSWTSELSTTVGGIPVAVPEFHHDVLLTSRDTMVVLSKGTVSVEDFPYDYDDPSKRRTEDVAQDLIIEFSPDDGTILKQWDVTTMLDLGRIGWESLNHGVEGYEWAHTNAVTEDVTNGRWILSSRNQDALFAIDQATGTVEWILANHDNWSAEYTDLLLTPGPGPFEWPYHQHAVKYDASTSRVLAFDNGNYRATPWTGVTALLPAESYSRVVEYTVDETGRTVVQNWEFRPDPVLFSYAMGDADWLSNGNVLADFAYVEWDGGQPMAELGRGNNTVRLFEFDPATGDVVWELDIWDPLSDPVNAWQAYRVQRIPRPYAPSGAP